MLLRSKGASLLKPQDSSRRSRVVFCARFFDCARDALCEKPRRTGRAELLQAPRSRVVARAFESHGSFVCSRGFDDALTQETR